jgi:alkanesulfonate monooxygenase SsuD/methylene tetrahydromethanopterin reductase-like flavin-dependent oxidoreductase (luciferase family)
MQAPSSPVAFPAIHPWVAAGQGRVRFGVDVGPGPDFAASVAWAQRIEELGFDSFWLRDHPARAPEDPFTYLAAIAVSTTRMRLGTLVACTRYRHPMLLARVAADVDRLSGGRLILGLGGGWDAREFAQMGLAFPTPGERLDALEETIQALAGLWGPEPFTYAGRHVTVHGANVYPGPLQPRVPLLIGGGGERRTLRLVAKYADLTNIEGHGSTGAGTPDELRHKFTVLQQHCASVGRPYEAITRSYFRAPVVVAETEAAIGAKLAAIPAGMRGAAGLVAGTPDQIIATFRTYVDAGTQYFILVLDDGDTARLLAEQVIPAFARNTS